MPNPTDKPLVRKKTCASCVHWEQEDSDGGSCRCYPPTVIVLDGDLDAKWPSTQVNDWCGEWGAKEDG